MDISEKEREVLVHLCEGQSYQQIADNAGKTVDTVRTILYKLRVRFNCPNSTALALYAKENILSNKSYPAKSGKGR